MRKDADDAAKDAAAVAEFEAPRHAREGEGGAA